MGVGPRRDTIFQDWQLLTQRQPECLSARTVIFLLLCGVSLDKSHLVLQLHSQHLAQVSHREC